MIGFLLNYFFRFQGFICCFICIALVSGLACGQSAAKDPQAGEVIRDCAVCPELVVIPPGSFTMGSPESEPGRQKDEGPERLIVIDYFLAFGRFEVTFEQWDVCVDAGGCPQTRDMGWGRGGQPVFRVSWHDAQKYVAWLREKTGLPYRLPSEAEWEYAARARGQYRYIWGDTFQPGLTNSGTGPLPVGSFQPNDFGLYDMGGNLREWVADCWRDNLKNVPADGRAFQATNEDCDYRVVRGGCFGMNAEGLRVANRNRHTPIHRSTVVGLRVVRELAGSGEKAR